jgi:YD repeat-containing protein
MLRAHAPQPYDAEDELIETGNPTTTVTEIGYNSQGQIDSETDAA